MRRFFAGCTAFLYALLALCTGNYSGGTTDTGNARVAVCIHTIGGGLASGAHVTICPADYQIFADNATGKIQRTVTNDSGYFEIDTIGSGDFTIEVNDDSASAVLLKITIDDNPEATIRITDTLELYSSISGNAGSVKDSSIERFVVIEGLDRKVPVNRDGTFELDDLPAGIFELAIVAESSEWQPLTFSGVTAHSGATVTVGNVSSTDTVLVQFNTKQNGTGVEDTVVNFPVLVRLTDAKLSGSGLQVIKKDGTPLSFTVASVDGSGRPATLWILADTLYGNRDDQTLLIISDTADTSLTSAYGTVFDSSSGFTACYHFDGTTEDATVNNFHGTDHGSTDTATGIIGRARAFDGISSYISLGDLPDRKKGTISFWFKPRSFIGGSLGKTQGIWGKKSDDFINATISLQGSDFYAGSGFPGRFITKMEDSTAGYYLSSTTESFSSETWYHAAWIWSGNGDSLYINGKLEAIGLNILSLKGNASEEIGRSAYDISNIANYQLLYYSGLLDEFRIDHTSRSAAWIRLCYLNQQTNDKLVKVIRKSVR